MEGNGDVTKEWPTMNGKQTELVLRTWAAASVCRNPQNPYTKQWGTERQGEGGMTKKTTPNGRNWKDDPKHEKQTDASMRKNQQAQVRIHNTECCWHNQSSKNMHCLARIMVQLGLQCCLMHLLAQIQKKYLLNLMLMSMVSLKYNSRGWKGSMRKQFLAISFP